MCHEACDIVSDCLASVKSFVDACNFAERRFGLPVQPLISGMLERPSFVILYEQLSYLIDS